MPYLIKDLQNIIRKLHKIDDIVDDNERKNKQTQRDSALEAILNGQLDSTDIGIALTNHKSFWQGFKKLKNADLTDFTKPVNEIDIPLQDFYNEVAEARVSFGLKNSNISTLVKIISSNTEQCRAYIASKQKLGKLDECLIWPDNDAFDPNQTMETNSSKTILNNASIKKIQDQARDNLIINLIENCNDTNLLDKIGDPINFDAHIKALLPITEKLENYNFEITDFGEESKGKISRLIATRIQSIVIEKTINNITKELNIINEDQKLLTSQIRDKINPLLEARPVHIFNPAMHKRNLKKEETEVYKERLEDFKAVLIKIEKNKERLKFYLEQIKPLPANEELKKCLEDELELCEENEEFYKRIVDRINEICIHIRQAKTKDYESTANGVVCTIDNEPIAGNLLNGTSVLVDPLGVTSNLENFDFKDKLNEGSIKTFEITYKAQANSPPSGQPSLPIDSKGKFTEQFSPLNKDVKSTYDGLGEVTKFPIKLYQINQFPKGSPTHPCTDAKVNFAMIMATQILANLEKPPTKDRPLRLKGVNEEELKYIWTALRILGENTPFMKFGADAIKVSSPAFDPAKEAGYVYGYASNSLHETVFKIDPHATAVKDHIKNLASVCEQRFDPKDKIKADNAIQSMNNFKDNLNKFKEEAKPSEEIKPNSSAQGLSNS